MKINIKLLTIALLGTALVGLQSCKEESVDPPADNSESCYLKTYTESDGSYMDEYAYTLDNDNKVAAATYDTTTTIFTYNGDQLISATDGSYVANFVYGSSSTRPDSVAITVQGQLAAYMKLTHSNDDITKLEIFLSDPQSGDIMVSRFTYGYDNSHNITSLIIDEYDFLNMTLVEAVKAENITNDGKNNPFARSMAYFFMHYENPSVMGASNITGATVTSDGTTSSLTISYTYDDNGNPLTSSENLDGETVTRTYGYQCQ